MYWDGYKKDTSYIDLVDTYRYMNISIGHYPLNVDIV